MMFCYNKKRFVRVPNTVISTQVMTGHDINSNCYIRSRGVYLFAKGATVYPTVASVVSGIYAVCKLADGYTVFKECVDTLVTIDGEDVVM